MSLSTKIFLEKDTVEEEVEFFGETRNVPRTDFMVIDLDDTTEASYDISEYTRLVVPQ